MTGPIYFGGIRVTGSSERNTFAVNRESLEKELAEQWKQEIHTVLKFIQDSKLNMPLMEQVLSSSSVTVTVQEYTERKSA